jgi:DNA-directed RNA polymerase subunit M/transcription elongation factor TFIIS
VTSGTKSRSEPPESVPNSTSTSITGELRCKRCSEAMTLVTVLSKFADRPRFKIFRCTACDFYDSVKA